MTVTKCRGVRLFFPAPLQLRVSSVFASCSFCFCIHTNTYKQTHTTSMGNMSGLPKNAGETSSSAFSGTSPHDMTADCMANQSETHKHTCSVFKACGQEEVPSRNALCSQCSYDIKPVSGKKHTRKQCLEHTWGKKVFANK